MSNVPNRRTELRQGWQTEVRLRYASPVSPLTSYWSHGARTGCWMFWFVCSDWTCPRFHIWPAHLSIAVEITVHSLLCNNRVKQQPLVSRRKRYAHIGSMYACMYVFYFHQYVRYKSIVRGKNLQQMGDLIGGESHCLYASVFLCRGLVYGVIVYFTFYT